MEVNIKYINPQISTINPIFIDVCVFIIKNIIGINNIIIVFTFNILFYDFKCHFLRNLENYYFIYFAFDTFIFLHYNSRISMYNLFIRWYHL